MANIQAWGLWMKLRFSFKNSPLLDNCLLRKDAYRLFGTFLLKVFSTPWKFSNSTP